MSVKKLVSLLLSAVLIMSFISACSNEKKEDSFLKKVYVRTDADRGSMQAHFLNTKTGEKSDIEMDTDKKEEKYSIYSVEGDMNKYDVVSFTRDNSDETMKLSFSEYVSGWYLSSYGVLPYVYGEEIDDENCGNADFDTVSLKYNDKRDKKIFIWVPDGYDKNDKNTKYSVIYMTDGQNLFKRTDTAYGCWNVAQSVESMNSMEESTKAIIVGIDNGDGHRDNELTPNIGDIAVGDSAYEDGGGAEFCDFVYDTVIPYIEENYNVYTDREHNYVCGSSSGGIESFYIGMEHPEKFSVIGALSPAFILFGDDVWKKYLSEKSFESYPLVYIYCGNSDNDDLERALCSSAKKMPDYLESINYPKDRIVEQYISDAAHNEGYWRAIFPEFLSLAFSQSESGEDK